MTPSPKSPGTSEQRLQGLLTAIAWDENDLNRQRVQDMLRLPTEGDGVLIFDDTGCAKQGRCSVGVARQYSGTLGKVGNCQVTVNCHYAERTIAWPVATRLYLPTLWAHDADRRAKAKVPEEVTFQTKPQIALDLLDRALEWGVRCACVTADADYGDNPNSWMAWRSVASTTWSPSAPTAPWPCRGAAGRRHGPMSWWGRRRRGRGAR